MASLFASLALGLNLFALTSLALAGHPEWLFRLLQPRPQWSCILERFLLPAGLSVYSTILDTRSRYFSGISFRLKPMSKHDVFSSEGITYDPDRAALVSSGL
ncbi:hypothetical protein OE88DRAFT_1647642 [Heliocybe sulcata]|uniref:Uncharacterized protein n=1 Tax=Heliocybe sulcata TaxID=5364 RepID=A0A5C3MSG3_9AGAM|nr:hypothetical protein OE88DRAFT_1647642 [Heliocybe sulcata]